MFEPCQIGDEAGITILLASNFHYTFSKRRTSQGDFLVIEKIAEDFHQIEYSEPITDGQLSFKIKADKEYYTFYYTIGGKPFELIGKASTRFLSCELAGKCFTGTVIGAYAVSSRDTDAVMEVTEFGIKYCIIS